MNNISKKLEIRIQPSQEGVNKGEAACLLLGGMWRMKKPSLFLRPHRSNTEETNNSDVFCAVGHRLTRQSHRKIHTLGLICDDCDARGGSTMYELRSESSSTCFYCAHC